MLTKADLGAFLRRKEMSTVRKKGGAGLLNSCTEQVEGSDCYSCQLFKDEIVLLPCQPGSSCAA